MALVHGSLMTNDKIQITLICKQVPVNVHAMRLSFPSQRRRYVCRAYSYARFTLRSSSMIVYTFIAFEIRLKKMLYTLCGELRRILQRLCRYLYDYKVNPVFGQKNLFRKFEKHSLA